jgi:murein DD-endopeptidase MepM/ murein hydrolase activator NlpD
MKNKRIILQYVHDTGAAPKTLRIPTLAAYLAVAFTVIVVFASISVLVAYSPRIRDVYKLSSLEKENEVLKTSIGEMRSQIETLNGQVAQNFSFQKKARILANLDDIEDDVNDAGAGGPHFAYARPLSILDESTGTEIQSLRSEIDLLVRQTKLQQESYDQILTSLSEQTELLNATPSIRPVPHGFVSSQFGRRMDPFTGKLSRHRGVDYSVRLGTPIFATADGVVSFEHRWSNFGNVVEITHGHGFVTRYAHVSKILVKKGQHVKRGDIIARVGSSGRSTAAHLHYEVLLDGTPRNPLNFVLSDQEIAD